MRYFQTIHVYLGVAYLEIEPELETLNRMLLSVQHRTDEFCHQRAVENISHLRRNVNEVSEMFAAQW
jgi:hypothetical protein